MNARRSAARLGATVGITAGALVVGALGPVAEARAATLGDPTTARHWVYVDGGCRVGGGRTTRAKVVALNRRGAAVLRVKVRLTYAGSKRARVPGKARNMYASTMALGHGRAQVVTATNPRGIVVPGPTRRVPCYALVARADMTSGATRE